jgi:hypothetical protein
MPAINTTIDRAHDVDAAVVRLDLSGCHRLVGDPAERLLTAQRELATWLHDRRRPKLDEVLANAVSGALIGALVGATLASIERGDPPDTLKEQILRVVQRIEPTLTALERGKLR